MKIFIYLVLVFLPATLNANIDVYLSTDQKVFHPDVWTSDIHTSENSIVTHYRYAREDVPLSYISTQSQIQNRILSLLSDLSESERQNRLQALLEKNEDNFLQYLAIALSPDIDADIGQKKDMWITLTPYEEVFDICDIDIISRREIGIDIIEFIYVRKDDSSFTLSDLEYGDIRFWDCIIPFPDRNRSSSDILSLDNVFASTRYMALTEQDSNNFLRFSNSQENNVSIFNISWTSFEQVQWLKINSVRLESELISEKSHWKNRIAYVHKNHYVNPFRNAHINWNQIWWMNYQWNQSFLMQDFNTSHPLFISATDTENNRTLLPWIELRPGIYKKILLQESTFDVNGNPQQKVGATSYYAILYNHDITPPFCEITLFSHDGVWNETFQLPEDPWFHTQKYMYFWCSDPESWCLCNSSIPWCFIKDNQVFSTPKIIPHLWDVSYDFINWAWNNVSCSSTEDKRVRYDFTSPDIRLYQDSIEIHDLTREFVSNDGILYDGNQISFKRYFSIEQAWEFQAGEIPEITFQIYDPWVNNSFQESSGLTNVHVSVSRYVWNGWQEIWVYNNSTWEAIPNYNIPLSNINQNISGYNIENQSWRYQLTFSSKDFAWNSLRATWQYILLPWPIDIDSSILEISQRNIYLANSVDTYEYQLTLRDEFWNVISWREYDIVEQSCQLSVWPCFTLRTDMTQDIPVWDMAITSNPLWWSISDENGRIFFDVASSSPGVFTERFSINFRNPDTTHIFTAEENTFLKPITWILETYDDGEWYNDRLFVWEYRNYRVRSTMTWVTVVPSFDLIWDIVARHPDTEFTLSWSISSEYDWIHFSWTFDSYLSDSEAHKILLEIIYNDISWLAVSYDIWWQSIRYLVSESNRNNNTPTLTDQREIDRPVLLIWWLQATWNAHNPNERQNISDLNSFLQRTHFRKNITQYIMNRESHSNQWGVKYVDMTNSINKNYIVNTYPDYETLVVRNWNILITEDFNPTNQRVWLISYIDSWYDIETWYESVGNIYVTPEVQSINASIYADGALISTTQDWNLVSSDIATRSDELENQLVIQGILFTRNTLAGWRELWWQYMLPWRRESDNQDIAIQYDLYYTRRGSEWCERDSYDFCILPQYLIIEYDSRVISNPPPLFSQ